MVNKQKAVAVISCLLIMLSTALAFNLFFENLIDVKMQWIPLLFLLLSEIILMAKLLRIRKQTIIANAHITSSIIHIMIVFLVTAPFASFIEKDVKLLVLINVVLLSVLIISDLLIYYIQYHTAEKNNEQLDAQDMIYRCISKVQQLSLHQKGTSFYTDLCKIEELLKYSDNTTITGAEAKIEALISELSILLDDGCTDSAPVCAKTGAIIAAIQERTAQMKAAKRGMY